MSFNVFEETTTTGRRNRGWIEITGLILAECLRGAVKTRVMYRCNLNSKQIQQYLSLLLDSGFLEIRRDINRFTDSYYTTERGMKFIDIYQQLQQVLEQSLHAGAKLEN